MDAWWVPLLREQQRDAFADVAGTTVSITLPVSERLINRVIAERRPPSMPVRGIEVVPHASEQVDVKVWPSKRPWVPPVRVRLTIEQQPQLPDSPTLVLALHVPPVVSFAAGALNVSDYLPPGVTLEGRHVVISLAALAERYAPGALEYLTALAVTTEEHRLVITATLAVPPRTAR